MIATLNGEITQIEDNSIIVEINGIGLRVFVPRPTRESLRAGETVLLYTHLIVRETELSLYGFSTKAERDLFNLLLSVDGVGPRVALSVLSSTTLDALQKAVFHEDPGLMGHIPGVGKKTAQKIILYLHDRLKPADMLATIAVMSDVDSEVLAALTALGYSVVEAQSAIQSIQKEASNDVEERLRLALQYFSGK